MTSMPTHDAAAVAEVERTLAFLMPNGYQATVRAGLEPESPFARSRRGAAEPALMYYATVTRPDGSTYNVGVHDPANLVADTIHAVFECVCEEESDWAHAKPRDRRAWDRKWRGERPSSMYRRA